MTCPDDETLAAIATLREAERAEILDHAASCATCRGLVADLLGVVTQASFAQADTLGAPPSIDTGLPPTIDRYRIERRIGAGAMGVVYSAYDPELARPVAIKVLRSGGSPERMKREAQALARLAHPNVVAVYDVGEATGATFVAMALVDGDNLRTWLQAPRTTSEIIDAIVQAARGLEVAHAAGIVHRDIKPDNMFVAKNGTVLVGDFGLARTAGEGSGPADLDLLSSSELTQTGAVVGTPAYMAPEQASGEASAATDQFALCVTAWEALYGERPFKGRTLGELVAAVKAGPPSPPRTRRVPSHVRAAIRRGLAADPDARHSSIAAFAAALGGRRRWPYAAAATAVLVAGGVAFAMRSAPTDPTRACAAIAAPSGWTLPRTMKAPAAATLDRILATYASDWKALATTSCVAAARRELSEPAAAATTRCLEQRRDTLFWITTQPTNVLALAEALEPIDTCRGRTEAAPSPELATLQRDLARATVVARYTPEKATGHDDLVARATKLGDQTSIAEANYLLALSRHASGRDPTTELQTAISAAERAGDDRIRTRASAVLAIVTARQWRLAEAQLQRAAAVSASARANDAVTLIAVERANIELAYIRRDFDAELAAFRRIEALQIARFGEVSESLVDTRFKIGTAMMRRRHPDAHEVLALAVEGKRKLGEVTPEDALNEAILAEENPVTRLPMQKQLVEIMRLRNAPELPEELKVLGLYNEIVGDYGQALEATRESVALLPASPAIENGVHYAFEIADRTDDATVRAAYLDEALGFIAKLPAAERDRDSIQAIHGRILLRSGRAGEAIPLLSSALTTAEAKEPQNPYHIAVRSFALAQALWDVGGAHDRERAVTLGEQAARRLPEVRAELTEFQDGALLERLDALLARIEAWRRTHR